MDDIRKKLESEIVIAAKSRDKVRLSTLRMVKSSIKNREIDSRKSLVDSEVVSVIVSMIKQRRDSIELFEKGGRSDLVAKEENEVEILQEFLPPPLSKEEVTAVVEEVIENIGASGLKDIGRVMKEVMPLISGRALGSEVNIIVKEILTSS